MLIAFSVVVLAVIGIYIAGCGKDWKKEVKADIKEIVSFAFLVLVAGLIVFITYFK